MVTKEVEALTSELDSFELRRRLSGVKYKELERLTGITYARVRDFFAENGRLHRSEVVILDRVLDEVCGDNESTLSGSLRLPEWKKEATL